MHARQEAASPIDVDLSPPQRALSSSVHPHFSSTLSSVQYEGQRPCYARRSVVRVCGSDRPAPSALDSLAPPVFRRQRWVYGLRNPGRRFIHDVDHSSIGFKWNDGQFVGNERIAVRLVDHGGRRRDGRIVECLVYYDGWLVVERGTLVDAVVGLGAARTRRRTDRNTHPRRLHRPVPPASSLLAAERM